MTSAMSYPYAAPPRGVPSLALPMITPSTGTAVRTLPASGSPHTVSVTGPSDGAPAPALASAEAPKRSGNEPHEFFAPMSQEDLQKKAPPPPAPGNLPK